MTDAISCVVDGLCAGCLEKSTRVDGAPTYPETFVPWSFDVIPSRFE